MEAEIAALHEQVTPLLERVQELFARLRSYLSTLHKQGVALLTAREILFARQPLSPAFA